ncbi:MAG: RNA polymerase sigma factor [Oscillospiraceae bacterium]|nr:RNA polymerase sigma factor [Oscillospiraceae bacterium]
MDDIEIIKLFQNRDETAIETTANIYGFRLLRLSFGILKNKEDSEECVNDTYLKTWKSIPPNIPRLFYPYIAKICRHLCFGVLDYKGAQKRNVEIVELSEELMCCIPDKLTNVEYSENEIGSLLSVFLKTLSVEHQRIFLLRYFDCKSIAEVASYCGSSESNVKTTLYRTRSKLKEHLNSEGIIV